MNRWIPTVERTPEPEVFVLCWDGKQTFVEWFGSKPDAGRGVTHWMPYPMPPGATSEMHDGRRAAMSASPAAASAPTASGFKLVPLEPTQAMFDAAERQWRWGSCGNCGHRWKTGFRADDAAAVYSAMLAAPAQPSAPQTLTDDAERMAFFAWVDDRGCDTDGAWSAWMARAALSRAGTAKPLTREQVARIYEVPELAGSEFPTGTEKAIAVARAIEAAHGITGGGHED